MSGQQWSHTQETALAFDELARSEQEFMSLLHESGVDRRLTDTVAKHVARGEVIHPVLEELDARAARLRAAAVQAARLTLLRYADSKVQRASYRKTLDVEGEVADELWRAGIGWFRVRIGACYFDRPDADPWEIIAIPCDEEGTPLSDDAPPVTGIPRRDDDEPSHRDIEEMFERVTLEAVAKRLAGYLTRP